MKTTDYINCKIIKYQRGDRVQRRDAIKAYRPHKVVRKPIKHIKIICKLRIQKKVCII